MPRINRYASSKEVRCCQECGKDFVYDPMVRRTQKRYCSPQCRRTFLLRYLKDYNRKLRSIKTENRQSRQPRDCERCKASFIQRCRHQVYCSASCRDADSFRKRKLRIYRQYISGQPVRGMRE